MRITTTFDASRIPYPWIEFGDTNTGIDPDEEQWIEVGIVHGEYREQLFTVCLWFRKGIMRRLLDRRAAQKWRKKYDAQEARKASR